MSQQPSFQQIFQRDGTSQAARMLPALDPDYVVIDEHSVKDLLAFARVYARELRYFDLDDQARDDWHEFLDSDVDLDDVVDFMQEPTKLPADKVERFSRPHFVLFLTFLQLLTLAQAQLNTLTRRHLDFYYQQALRVTKRGGIPDHVNVLVDLDSTSDEFLLPAGTLLNAGVDNLGQDRFYSTERDLVVNHAQIARLSSLYTDRRVIGVREAREDYDGPKTEAFMFMLQIALGVPNPGDPLPVYDTGKTVDYDFLKALKALVDFVPKSLFMNFAEFRNLIRLKQQRDQADPEWDEINALLLKAYKERTGKSDLKIPAAKKRDFDANFFTALNIKVDKDPSFDGLTEVKSIYDLYNQRTRESVQAFITACEPGKLYFKDINDFFRLMQIKTRIDAEWEEINRILEEAGQKKRQNDSFHLAEEMKSPNFDKNLNEALGTLTYPTAPSEPKITNLDQYYLRLVAVEQYFFTSAEKFSFLMDTAENPQATAQQWNRVYTILAEAHEKKVFAERTQRLQQLREQKGFEAMLAFALGDLAASGLSNLELVIELISNPQDADFLRTINTKVEGKKTISAEDWDTTYSIVERAQRVLLDKPIAQKVEWVNLYSNEDATSARVTLGIESDADNPRWHTFGQAQVVTPDDPLPLSFGWAVTSPVLALSEGVRTITLTLGFQSTPFDGAAINAVLTPSNPAQPIQPFLVQISTSKGWIEPDTVSIKRIDYAAVAGITKSTGATIPAIQFQLTFGKNVAALTAFPDAQIESPWPVLRVLLRQIWVPDNPSGTIGHYITYYQPFQDLVLLRTHLAVVVVGLIPAQIQNDETVLNPKKPFEPFGTSAVAGAHFYLSHPELVSTRLDSLDFNIDWMGVPKDLGKHYTNYPDLDKPTNDSFNIDISLIDENLPLTLATKASLFETADASVSHTISVKDVPQAIKASFSGFLYTRASRVVQADDLLDWNRYVQWELNSPDFQITNYPAAVAQKSLDLSVAVANKKAADTIDAALYKVNPPYTPKIKSLTLNYTASVEILIERYAPDADRIYHIEPFGYYEIQPEGSAPQVLFLPQYRNEGELYIGIRDVYPPQNLSLLFQMAEGSANPDLEPVPVQWSYLSGNRWVSLDDGNLLLDTTRGLINSGITIFSLEEVQPNTRLSADLYWIRGSIRHHSDSVCDTVAIHTQAVSAVFVDRGNAPDHLSQPLPPKTITDLAQPLPQIQGIRQPYTSFGGRSPEEDHTFYTRIGERLRHKHRALTMWDYEHLILEQFPQIYKAKCLPATASQPGRVEIVVIPDIRNKLPFNPFEPKAPSDLIADIEAFLAENIPAYATVKVKNARFIAVKVRFAVRFRSGYNEGYYKKLLNDELNHFLSPWAYQEGDDIVIGGRIYANVIINFIEERPYVDYVSNIKLFTSEDGETFKLVAPSADDGYWVETEQPDGVLVVAPQHEIDMILGTSTEDEVMKGINFMKIELDFVVG